MKDIPSVHLPLPIHQPFLVTHANIPHSKFLILSILTTTTHHIANTLHHITNLSPKHLYVANLSPKHPFVSPTYHQNIK